MLNMTGERIVIVIDNPPSNVIIEPSGKIASIFSTSGGSAHKVRVRDVDFEVYYDDRKEVIGLPVDENGKVQQCIVTGLVFEALSHRSDLANVVFCTCMSDDGPDQFVDSLITVAP